MRSVDVVHLDLDPNGLLLHFLGFGFSVFSFMVSTSWLVLFSFQ